jgi:hypothetical protein
MGQPTLRSFLRRASYAERFSLSSSTRIGTAFFAIGAMYLGADKKIGRK